MLLVSTGENHLDLVFPWIWPLCQTSSHYLNYTVLEFLHPFHPSPSCFSLTLRVSNCEQVLYLTCPQTHYKPAILSSSHSRICFSNTNNKIINCSLDLPPQVCLLPGVHLLQDSSASSNCPLKPRRRMTDFEFIFKNSLSTIFLQNITH